jgi:glycosyltransferase involved in cell wall biosynthesis
MPGGGGLRVLRVIHDLQVGGVQRMMFKQLTELRALGVECEVCCIDKRGELADGFEAAGIPVHVIHLTSRLDPVGLFRLRRLARRGRFDIVHAHMYAANMAASHALLGARGIVVVNGYHSTIPSRNEGQSRRIRRTARMADGFVAVSGSVRDVLPPLGIDPARIHVVENGTVLPEAEPGPREAAPGDPLRLVWAGRFVEAKRLERFVPVMAACRERGVEARLTLVGEGPHHGRMRARVEEAGLGEWIALPGLSHSVPADLAGADLFVSMSEREGLPNAVLEACAAGRGLVLSDIPPHREVVGRNPSAGMVLAADDPAEWARVLGKLAGDRDRVRAMGRAAFETARAYSVRESALKMKRLYEALAARKRA